MIEEGVKQLADQSIVGGRRSQIEELHVVVERHVQSGSAVKVGKAILPTDGGVVALQSVSVVDVATVVGVAPQKFLKVRLVR